MKLIPRPDLNEAATYALEMSAPYWSDEAKALGVIARACGNPASNPDNIAVEVTTDEATQTTSIRLFIPKAPSHQLDLGRIRVCGTCKHLRRAYPGAANGLCHHANGGFAIPALTEHKACWESHDASDVGPSPKPLQQVALKLKPKGRVIDMG